MRYCPSGPRQPQRHDVVRRSPSRQRAPGGLAATFAALATLFGPERDVHAQSVTVTTVESTVDGYGTFQSHNQKVVATQHGIFATYVKSSANKYSALTWRLARSTNGGASFSTVYESTVPSYPPAIEAGRDGTIYLVHSDYSTGLAHLKRFSPSNGFAVPVSTPIPMGHGYKFALALDEARGRLYYAVVNLPPGDTTRAHFFSLSLTGTVLLDYHVTQPGSIANAHYPHLTVDEQTGDLYLAWTTLLIGGTTSDYYSSHVVRSRDRGASWQRLNGTSLAVPIVPDPAGPTDQVNLASETVGSKWLSNMLVKEGKLHFIYAAQSYAREHYVRFDLTSGAKDVDIYPVFGGATTSLYGLDGFCAGRPGYPDRAVYCVSKSRTEDRLAVVRSLDNGQTWTDYALGPVTTDSFDSIGGFRGVTDDGHVIGTYTTGTTAVRFFKIAVGSLTSARLSVQGVSASHGGTGPHVLANAVDNNASTYWVAMPATGANSVQLDFGAVRYVGRARWTGSAWFPSGAHSPADYSIATSIDGTTWTTVLTKTNASGVVNGDERVDLQARYVRLSTTKINDGTGWALGLAEFWAEGTALPATTRAPSTVAAYSSQAGYPASNAGDGNGSTAWVSTFSIGPANNNTWTYLDLGSVRSIGRLRWNAVLHSQSGPPIAISGPADYTVYVSNDAVTWTPVDAHGRTHANAWLFGDEPVYRDARFVGIATSKVNDGTGWSLGFWELWAEIR